MVDEDILIEIIHQNLDGEYGCFGGHYSENTTKLCNAIANGNILKIMEKQ